MRGDLGARPCRVQRSVAAVMVIDVSGVVPGCLRAAPTHQHYVEIAVCCGELVPQLAAEVMLNRQRFRLTERIAGNGAEVLWDPR